MSTIVGQTTMLCSKQSSYCQETVSHVRNMPLESTHLLTLLFLSVSRSITLLRRRLPMVLLAGCGIT